MSGAAVMDGAEILTPEAMLAASAARTGLADFGGEGFREGLDLLLADIRALDLDPACVAASAFRIGQSLDTRALAVKGLKRHPELLDQPVRAPVIIAGLVRSGTTALHLLLSLDPQFQGPEHWLTVYPMPRPAREDWDAIPEYRAEKAALDAFLAAAPEAAAVDADRVPELVAARARVEEALSADGLARAARRAAGLPRRAVLDVAFTAIAAASPSPV